MNSNGNIILPSPNPSVPAPPPFTASGISWIDHQWFNVPSQLSSLLTSPFTLRGNHEWFSIQLDNNVQIVAWNIFKEASASSFVLKDLDSIDSSGTQTHYTDVTIDPKSYWKAPDGKTFAGSWRIYKEGEFDLTIVPTIQNQYVQPAGTYGGSTNVTGTYKGAGVKGQGYAEMTLTYFNTPCDALYERCADGVDNDCDYRIDEFCPVPTPTSTPTSTPTPTPSSTQTLIPYSSSQLTQKSGSAGSWRSSLIYVNNGLTLKQVGLYGSAASGRSWALRKSYSYGGWGTVIKSGNLSTTANNGYYTASVPSIYLSPGYYIFQVYTYSGTYYYGNTIKNYPEINFLKRRDGNGDVNQYTGTFQVRFVYTP